MLNELQTSPKSVAKIRGLDKTATRKFFLLPLFSEPLSLEA